MSTKAAKAIRKFCLDCQGGYAASVHDCQDTACELFPHRYKMLEEQQKLDNPLRAVRRFCLVCAGMKADVRTCGAKGECPLWSFRFGVLPTTFKRVAARRKRTLETLFLPGVKPGSGLQ